MTVASKPAMMIFFMFIFLSIGDLGFLEIIIPAFGEKTMKVRGVSNILGSTKRITGSGGAS